MILPGSKFVGCPLAAYTSTPGAELVEFCGLQLVTTIAKVHNNAIQIDRQIRGFTITSESIRAFGFYQVQRTKQIDTFCITRVV